MGMVRRGALVVLLVSALLAVPACGDDDADVRAGDPGSTEPPISPAPTASPPPDDPDAIVASPPLPPGDGSAPAPSPRLVEPRPGMVNTRPVAFEQAMPVDDGRTLEVRFWSGVEPCYVLDRVEVEEGPDRLEITLFVGSDPAEPTTACIEIAEYLAVMVPLGAPLGDRPVVDGAA